MDAAYTEDNAIAMGINISLPKALSDPICKRKRKPQINKKVIIMKKVVVEIYFPTRD
jgi:hypothetical protein